mgnify:CR=1 FL=1
MIQKTSVHIKPCNIGQSEAHNQRTKAYLDHINAEKLYIRKDLMPQNLSWASGLQGQMTLQQYYDAIGGWSRKRPAEPCRPKNAKE